MASISQPSFKGPAFYSVNNGSGTSLLAVTHTKIVLNQEIYDTEACYDISSYRFTPTKPGYYDVSASINYSSINVAGQVICEIYKNGGPTLLNMQINGGSSAQEMNAQVNGTVYMNGSTDYLELYGWQNGGGTRSITVGNSSTFMCASFARGA